MKKMIVAATLLALAGANLPSAKAGDCGWTTAGKILTGVAVGVAVVNTLNCQPAYYPVAYPGVAPCPAPVIYAPPRPVCAPVVYVPAPVVVYPRPVFVTPRPLVNVNYGYGYRHPGRGYAHGYRR